MSTQSEPSLTERVEQLVAEGVTSRAEQAERLEVNYHTFMRHLRKADMPSPARPSLGRWIPWKFTRTHHNTATAKKLRLLAQAADRREPQVLGQRRLAVEWAKRLVSAGLDLTYDRSEGFVIVPADDDAWYIRDLLNAAEHYIQNLQQVDDLGERSE